jgi:hypothetical protein
MSTAKRQQTMAKRNRERAVEEKRTLKRLKKQAARAEKAAGEFTDPHAEAEFGTEAESAASAASEAEAEFGTQPESAAPAASEPDVE